MEKVLLNAKKRTQIDKAARSLLRREGKIPAVFYSKHHEPIPVEVEERLSISNGFYIKDTSDYA